MSLKYIKVSLLAYLFLFITDHLLYGQHKPAWEHASYMDIHKLHLHHPKNTLSPEEAYIKGYKLTLSNLMMDIPSPVNVISQLENLTTIIEESATPQPYKQYYLNDIDLFNALMELKNGSEVKFMWMMNQIYRKSATIADEYPEFIPVQKLDALMQIMVGSVPDQYQWFFNLLGFDGDVHKGLKTLEMLSKYDGEVKHEGTALYYLVTNYLQPELSGHGLIRLSGEVEKEDELHLLRFIAGLSYIKQHQSLKAREMFKGIDWKVNFPIIHYFLGETYLHEGKMKEAVENYQLFLKDNNGENLVKDTYFKIYLCHYLMGDPAGEKYKVMALKEGESRSEADKNAERLLNSTQLPAPEIFKLRFLTDGGFLNEAQELINSSKTSNFNKKDRIEFVYRRARVSHLSGEIKNAISQYEESIKLYDGRYFAPNACLQLGYIYESRNDQVKARYYFEKVLTFKNYTYESSLRSKARSALKTLNNH